MDRTLSRPGRIDHEVALPPAPLSPWLRVAHVWTIRPEDATGTGKLRTIRDHLLLLQLRGRSWIHWPPAGGAIPLPAGAVACIPPDQPHAWGEEPGAHLAVHFDLHAQPALRGLATIRASGHLVRPQPVAAAPVLALGGPEPLRLPLVTRLDDPAGFRRLLAPLPALVERLASGPAPRLRAAAILAEALLRLALPPADARQSMELEALLAAIAADPAQPWPLPALARRLGLSAPSLRRHVVRATGLPPRAWIERQRMALAERLLLAGRPVAAVAEAVGYADAFHFSRVFRRVTGTAPSRWGR